MYPDASELTNNRPLRRFQNVTNDSETYRLIWLGKNINADDESVKTQKKLKQTINQFEVFEDLDAYVNHLTDLVDQKIVFIVSETFGRIVVPVIHDFPQVRAAYVYSFDEQATEGWPKENKKVKSTFLFERIEY